MDLQTIAKQTALPLRTLRYVVDHSVVPNLRLRHAANEAGRPRLFSEDMGVAIACAAHLLLAGMKRDTVANFLESLSDLSFRSASPKAGLTLADIIRNRLPSKLLLGDGVNVRCLINSADLNLDSGWVQPGTTARLANDYQPMVVIQLDLGRLFSQLFS